MSEKEIMMAKKKTTKKMVQKKGTSQHSRMLDQIRIRFAASGVSLLRLSQEAEVLYSTCYRAVHQGKDVPTRTADKLIDALERIEETTHETV